MAFDTIIQQGRFSSDGAARTLEIRSDIDWMRVVNYTNSAAAAAGATEFYWQRGMAAGTGVRYFKAGAANPISVDTMASGGFTLIDTTGAIFGSAVAITSSTNMTEPVFNTGDTSGLVDGSIVRIQSLAGQPNLNGYDFAIDNIVGNTSFKMAAALQQAPGAAGGAGTYKIVNFDPAYYPPHRYIANIATGATTTVTLTVPSQYQVGQKVKFHIPAVFGMTELDGVEATVTAVNDAVGTQTITVNVDTSAGFSAFVFPTAAQAAVALGKAMVYPVGMDTAYALSTVPPSDILSDAVFNTGFLGMKLGIGTGAGAAEGPAGLGAAPDQMYWIAGKSFSVDNS
ncbi:MAG: hypothetical protein R3230_01425 [Nitrosopumilaceae archaeon]|nr:hypothetical protein [Nitrosopumilaceae archaeon]